MNVFVVNNECRNVYWNEEYVDYWKRRVEKTNESSVTDNSLACDPTTTDDLYLQLIRRKSVVLNQMLKRDILLMEILMDLK